MFLIPPECVDLRLVPPVVAYRCPNEMYQTSRKANQNMSNIKTTLENTITKKANQPRTIKDWYNKLDEEDQTAIAEALISGDVSVTEMHRILKNLETNPIPFEITAFKNFARKLKETK